MLHESLVESVPVSALPWCWVMYNANTGTGIEEVVNGELIKVLPGLQ